MIIEYKCKSCGMWNDYDTTKSNNSKKDEPASVEPNWDEPKVYVAICKICSSANYVKKDEAD